jgi:hypothetical protein
VNAGRDGAMERISAAVAAFGAGDRDGARAQLSQVWSEIHDGDPLHRCFLAHYMADLQDDVRDELRWDLRALAAADDVTEERAQAFAREFNGALDVRALYPSLHLNLGDDYRRLGATAQAREHLALAQSCMHVLPDDGYGRMIRHGIDQLAARLGMYTPAGARAATRTGTRAGASAAS